MTYLGTFTPPVRPTIRSGHRASAGCTHVQYTNPSEENPIDQSCAGLLAVQDSRRHSHAANVVQYVCVPSVAVVGREVGIADVGGSTQDGCTGQDLPCHQRHHEFFRMHIAMGVGETCRRPSRWDFGAVLQAYDAGLGMGEGIRSSNWL